MIALAADERTIVPDGGVLIHQAARVCTQSQFEALKLRASRMVIRAVSRSTLAGSLPGFERMAATGTDLALTIQRQESAGFPSHPRQDRFMGLADFRAAPRA